MSHLQRLFLIAVMTLGASSYKVIPPDTVRRLLSNLTTGYDPRIRPTYYQEQKLWVFAMAFPNALVELSTADQRLTMFMYFSIVWTDQFLVWNATEYDGIDHIAMSVDEIWHPKLMVNPVNSDKLSYIKDDAAEVLLQSNGTVQWLPGSSVSVLCDVDITFYPFDIQKCPFLIYEPFATADVIELKAIPYDIAGTLYYPNVEWHLLDVTLNETIIGGSNIIEYTYVFQRRAEFVVYTTIIPLTLLAILNACVVLVPVSSGEKGSIAVTLFLSYCVYLTAIGETLPPNSLKTSILLVYMTIVQSFSALTMLFSIIETRMYINGNDVTPSCFSCARNQSKKEGTKENREGGVIETETQKTGNADAALSFYRRLDNVAFLVCFALNVSIVIVITVLCVNNLHQSI